MFVHSFILTPIYQIIATVPNATTYMYFCFMMYCIISQTEVIVSKRIVIIMLYLAGNVVVEVNTCEKYWGYCYASRNYHCRLTYVLVRLDAV